MIRRFLLILVFVSLSEELLNVIYEQVVFPWMSQSLHIDFFTAGMENGQSIDALLRGGVYLAAMGVYNQAFRMWRDSPCVHSVKSGREMC